MSLYRQAGRAGGRTVAVAAAVALLAGGGIGYAIGAAGGDEEPSLAGAVAELRSDLQPIANGLELVPTEYAQGVRDGRVVSEPEYGAAKAAAARAHDVLLSHEADLRALAPSRLAALRATLDALTRAVDRRGSDEEVRRLASRAQTQLAGVVRPQAG